MYTPDGNASRRKYFLYKYTFSGVPSEPIWSIWAYKNILHGEITNKMIRPINFVRMNAPHSEKMHHRTCAVSEGSDQSAHLRSIIGVFADHM